MTRGVSTTAAAVALVLTGAGIVAVPHDDPAPSRTGTSANVSTGPSASVASTETAVEAALRFVRAPQEWLFLAPEELDRILARELAPGAEQLAERLAAEAAEAHQGLAGTDGTVWFTISPLAWRVESTTATSAVISVWAVTVLSAPGVAAPQADWSTTRITVQQVEGRWRLAGFEDRPGPTPQPGATDTPWTADRVDQALDGYQRVGAS